MRINLTLTKEQQDAIFERIGRLAKQEPGLDVTKAQILHYFINKGIAQFRADVHAELEARLDAKYPAVADAIAAAKAAAADSKAKPPKAGKLSP
jgi:hypothetical protein